MLVIAWPGSKQHHFWQPRIVLPEDRFLTTLSSQSSTGSTHLQLPTPPEIVAEHMTGANTLSEQDTTSSSEGIVQFWSCISLASLWQVYEIHLGNGKSSSFVVCNLPSEFTARSLIWWCRLNLSPFQMCLMDTHWDLQTAKWKRSLLWKLFWLTFCLETAITPFHFPCKYCIVCTMYKISSLVKLRTKPCMLPLLSMWLKSSLGFVSE